nr:hypothetical protein [Parapedobacter composti]
MKKQSDIPPRSVSYREAQHIAVLIPLQRYEDLAWITDLANRLQKDGKTCSILGFSEFGMDIPPQLNLTLLGPADLTWNFIPKGHAIKSFISVNFDLLLNLCADDTCLPLDYASIKAKAAFRIGRYNRVLSDGYGWMIKGELGNSTTLLTAIKHYLGKIQ